MKPFSIYILFFTLWLSGCSLLPSEIKIAEQLMETNPDSALHLLQRLHPDKSMIEADRALYGLLYFQALDKNKSTTLPDSLINFSLNYYLKENDIARLSACYFYKARIYKNSQQYEQATVLYLKSLDYCTEQQNFNLLGKIYADMGDICSFQEDYKVALNKYQLSVNYFNRAGKTVDARNRTLDIGRTYRLIKNYKAAQKYYLLALNQTNDSIFIGVALQEIGINYYWAKQYDSAQFYIRKSLHFPYKGTNYAIRCFTLSDLFFDVEKYDSTFKYASKALLYPSNYITKRECYRLLANTEYVKGDFKQMANYMTLFQSYSDSVRNIESQTKITVLEDLHQTSETVGKTKHYLIILGWLLPFILMLSLIIFFRLRKHNKGKEKQLIEAEVQLSEKQNLFIDSLIIQLQETRASKSNQYKKATITQREQMDKDLYNTCLHVNDWNAFKQLMNKTFNNIINTLESNYSDLTRKDLTWCCLFLLNIPNQDIALILDSQPGSLYKLKQRLTQKLNLKSTKDLDLLLKEKSKGK